MYSCNCPCSILRDHDGLAVGGVPLVQVVRQAGRYGLRVARVIVPPIVAVDGNNINKLRLENGEDEDH